MQVNKISHAQKLQKRSNKKCILTRTTTDDCRIKQTNKKSVDWRGKPYQSPSLWSPSMASPLSSLQQPRTHQNQIQICTYISSIHLRCVVLWCELPFRVVEIFPCRLGGIDFCFCFPLNKSPFWVIFLFSLRGLRISILGFMSSSALGFLLPTIRQGLNWGVMRNEPVQVRIEPVQVLRAGANLGMGLDYVSL